jgi:hypothetical protein
METGTMSYEFSIEFQNEEAMEQVLQNLKSSQLVNFASQRSVTLKDPELASSAPYDVGFSLEDDATLSVHLLFKSRAIYWALIEAIGAADYVCKGDCDEETGLQEIFRIRSQ